jgi:two-component system, NarL family, sensor kinase
VRFIQDEERRRIARELHDSVGQYLAALGMGLAQLENGYTSKSSETPIECWQLLGRCVSETRTLSYLLHPPLLDEAGFVSAATNCVEEFSRRSKIATEISLDLPYRLPADTEILLFRVLQESLTNIHRHSDSGRKQVRAGMEGEAVYLEVRDFRHGIPQEDLESAQPCESVWESLKPVSHTAFLLPGRTEQRRSHSFQWLFRLAK